jgi:gluconate kinase
LNINPAPALHTIQTITMPLKSRKLNQNSVEQEGRIQLVISALKKDNISSIRHAVTVFNMPYLTLQNQLNRKQYRIKQRANSHRLSKNQEASLVK